MAALLKSKVRRIRRGNQVDEGSEKEKNNRKTGGNYEQAAGFYLEQHGYQILQYNYRCRIGEIDIVAKEGRIWYSVK